ncbi:MAG: 2Fe-2S iron-sulfur cluster-binding protein [Burkholderia sp.]
MQQAMVDCHGSQCSFCTTRLREVNVGALREARLRGVHAHRDLGALTGNLCRCTGYRPIVDATERMFEMAPPAGPIDEAALRAAKPEACLLAAGNTNIGLCVTKQVHVPDPFV